jgi:hypothetical protein
MTGGINPCFCLMRLPLLALLRSAAKSAIWSLSGDKRTCDQADATSHFDPQRQFAAINCRTAKRSLYHLVGAAE